MYNNNNIPMSFEIFLTELKNGDEYTWSVFFNHYHEKLRNFCYKKASNLDVDELISTLFEKLVTNNKRRIKKFINGSELQFKAYLYISMQNVIIAESRKIKNFINIDDVNEVYLIAKEDDEDKKFEKEILVKALSSLPPKKKQIMELVLEGKKHREISDILNIPLGSVSSHVARSIPILREELLNLSKEF